MQDLINNFLNYKIYNQGRTRTTTYRYKAYLLKLSAYLEQIDRDIYNCDLEDLQRFTGLYLHSEGYKPVQRKVAVSAIREFYKYLELNKITKNIAERLASPKIGYKNPYWIKDQNVEKILMEPGIDTFVGLRDTTMIATLFGSGIRVSGLTGLNESSLSYEGNDLYLSVVEKGKKEREVPVPIEVGLLIRAYLGHNALEKYDRTLPDGDQVLFVNLKNQHVPVSDYRGEAVRINPKAVWQIIRFYGERAGIPKEELKPHAFRHRYGVMLAENGIDTLTRAELLGHASPETTKIYTHLERKNKRKIVEKINPFKNIHIPLVENLRTIKNNIA